MQLGRNGKATPCWFIRRFLFSWNLPISFQASHNLFIIATDNLIGALINDNCNVIDSWRIFDWTVIILQRSMKNKYFIQWNNPILLSHSQSCYKQFVFFSKYIPTPLSTGWCYNFYKNSIVKITYSKTVEFTKVLNSINSNLVHSNRMLHRRNVTFGAPKQHRSTCSLF